jgi:hypothetical protein
VRGGRAKRTADLLHADELLNGGTSVANAPENLKNG